MATMKFKHQGLRKLRKLGLVPTDRALAEAIGVDTASVHRVLNGKLGPGGRFIAGCVIAFGYDWFSDLFEAVSDERAS
jgi:hypothetical protein